MKHIIMEDSAWTFSVEPFPAYRISLIYGRNKRDREFLPVQGIELPAIFVAHRAEFLASNEADYVLYRGANKTDAEKAKADYEALPPIERKPLFSGGTAKPEMVKRTAKVEEVTSTPTLPEGKFRLITTKEKGTKLIVPGEDNTNDVLLFTGCSEGFRGGVALVKEATTGEIVKTCQAGNATGGRIEVIARLKVGQSVAFATWGRRSDEVFVLTWDGQKVMEKHYSKAEWDAEQELKNSLAEKPNPAKLTVENFSRHLFSVDQISALKKMFDEEISFGEAKAPFFKDAKDFASQVSSKTAAIVAPADYLLEAQADGLLAKGTILLFWRADEEARKRGNHASRALTKFVLGEDGHWTKEVVEIEPTVEVDLKSGATYKYGGQPLI